MARLSALFSLAATLLSVAACGAERTGGARGTPAAVVDAAPERTLAAGAASFESSAPGAQRSGRVDFDAPPGRSTTAGPGGGAAGDAYPELSEPRAMVDLVRGAVAVESYGGAAVRGASTFRYEAVINVERAVAETPAPRRAEVEAFAARLRSAAFYVDLWVDQDGRLRRIQVPVEKTTRRPEARSKVLPQFVTVDLFDYAGP